MSIDLSNFASATNGTELITIPFVKGAPSKGPCLFATFKVRPLKYNDKTLVKVTSIASSANDSRLVKTIGGEDYFLDKTASEPSPTTLDTQSETTDNNDDDDLFDSPDVSHEDGVAGSSSGNVLGGGVVVEELRRRIDDLSQQLEASDSESFNRLATIREKDKEIGSKEKEIVKLRKDKDDLVEQLERLKKPAGKSEVDILRSEAVERYLFYLIHFLTNN